MRRILGLLALFALVAVGVGAASRSYDAGYSAGFEDGAVEAAEAATGEPSTAIRVVTPGDRFRGPGPAWFLFPLAFLLFVPLLFGAAARGRRWGSPHHWGPREEHLRRRAEAWHREAHDGEDWPRSETGADPPDPAS